MAVISVTKDTFDLQINGTDKPVLLDFWAQWCGPCRLLSPVVEEIAAEREDIVVGKVNVDEEPELAQRFQIMSIPTLVVLKNGQIVNTAVGARPKQAVLELLESVR